MKPFETCGTRKRNYKHWYKQILIVSVVFFLLSCGDAKRNHNSPSADIPEIQIGNQIWMASNYDGASFRNGDPIPHAISTEEWQKAGNEKRPAWCYYENDTSIGRKYGRIYNWYAINDARGFSPEGWHVPTNDELITLENFVGSSEAGLRLKCNSGSNKNGNVNNSSKFCLLLGGYRGKEGGFSGIEEFTYLSSSTERDQKENDVWGRGIHTDNSTIMRCGLFKEHGLYVRLIKN